MKSPKSVKSVNNIYGIIRMPLTDAVARECIAKAEGQRPEGQRPEGQRPEGQRPKGCTLINKCDECKKEIEKLIEIDEMYVDYFKQLEYLKTKSMKK